MKAIALLFGMLVLSYVGSLRVTRRSINGVGFASGAEYVALGFLLGPTMAGFVSRQTLDLFAPLLEVALGWIGMTIGLDLIVPGAERSRGLSTALGVTSTFLTVACVALTVFLGLSWFGYASPWARLVIAGGVGVVLAETANYSVRWAAFRDEAHASLGSHLAEIAHSGDAVPILALAVLFAAGTHQRGASEVVARVLLTVVVGGASGFLAAILFGRTFRRDRMWTVLLGTALLGAGVARTFDLAVPAALFTMGATIALVSNHRKRLRVLVAPTERAVLLPVLLVAGACIDFHTTPMVLGVLGAALFVRLVSKTLLGVVASAAFSTFGKESIAIGVGLSSAGALSFVAGLALKLRFDREVGNLVLLASLAAAVLGEIVAPPFLRWGLRAHARDVGESRRPVSEASS